MIEIVISYVPENISVSDERGCVPGIRWDARTSDGTYLHGGTAIPEEGNSRDCWLATDDDGGVGEIPSCIVCELAALATERRPGSFRRQLEAIL